MRGASFAFSPSCMQSIRTVSAALVVFVLAVQVTAGVSGRTGENRIDVAEAEQLLKDLGYWTGPVDRKFDPASRQALIAFQKLHGRKPTGRLTLTEIQAIRTASKPSPRERGFPHVEIDLDRQVLLMVDQTGNVSGVLPVSTGNGELFTSEEWTRPAVTPVGRFRIYRQISGWRKSPLGLMYYPNYIVGGVAIHGNPVVPTRPASHGCIRIPMFAATKFSELVSIGTVVIVHRGSASSEERVRSEGGSGTWNHYVP